MPNQIIELNNISKRFGNRSVLENVSMRLEQGQITTLIGPNGAGKSTLVRIVLGLIQADLGSIYKSGPMRMGYMPQKITIDPTLPLTTLRFLQLAESQASKCRSALVTMEVDYLADTPIQALSGGEMQRALLARAILRHPTFLVLDEPVQGVDLNGQSALYNTISRLVEKLNCGILMVSHDLHLVMSATDHVICLNQHICCMGRPEHVQQHPGYTDIFGHMTAVYSHSHDHHHTLQGQVVGSEHTHSSECEHD